MVDISATGASVIVDCPITGNFTISRFSDEGSPFEFNEIEVTGSALSINGELITWAKPVAYACSVTVVPGTNEDHALNKILMMSRTGFAGGQTKAVNARDVICNITLNIPCITDFESDARQYRYSFVKGRIVAGPTAPSASTDGRLVSRTYTFVFESMERSDNSNSSVFSASNTAYWES